MTLGFRTCGLAFGLIAAAAVPSQAALVVSGGANSNVFCASGECHATAADAVLNVKVVKQMLKLGDLQVTAGAGSGDIRIEAEIDWTKPHRLTLNSSAGIVFTRAATSQGTGGVTLVTGSGDYSFTDKGRITFWGLSSSLIINGTTFTLVGDLAALADGASLHPTGAFALASVYDASADGAYAGPPIMGSFSGTFTGLGHTIGNLKIATTKRTSGLFEDVAAGGTVRDVFLNHVDVGGRGRVGAVAATNEGTIANVQVAGRIVGAFNSNIGGVVGYSTGTVANATVSGTVAGQDRSSKGSHVIGGVAGFSTGTVTQSRSSAAIRGGDGSITGGLVGESNGTISRSSASGAVQGGSGCSCGDSYVGGLAGVAASISLSSATGPVAGGSGNQGESHDRFVYAGGLAGAAGVVDRSYATGSVKVGEMTYAGGLVGMDGNGGAVINSYALGDVNNAGDAVGGLIGLNYASVTAAYSTGMVKGGAKGFVGGAIGGDGTTTLSSVYWDKDTSGITDPSRGAGNKPNDPGITGLTTAQLQSGLPSGFDPSVWGESAGVNGGLPYLLDLPPQ